VKADFTGLTGDDIAQLVFRPTNYNITDNWSLASFKVSGPGGRLAYYGELATHFGRTDQDGPGLAGEQFHTNDAAQYCDRAPHDQEMWPEDKYAEALATGKTTGGPTSEPGALKSLYIGQIVGAFTEGDTVSPALLVPETYWVDSRPTKYTDNHNEEMSDTASLPGAIIPSILVMVAGKDGRFATYVPARDGVDSTYNGDGSGTVSSRAIGRKLVSVTGWDLSGMYAVTDKPGRAGDTKPDKNDMTNRYVSHVNYVTGYICETDLP
ncbi:hypothetical protein AAHJ18_004530, partial [Salmonella enterica]